MRVLFLIVCILQVGCDDQISHPYSGRQLDPAKSCLAPPTVIDVVSGAPPGSCPATCLVAYHGQDDAGPATYIGVTCPPFPPDYDATGKDPSCGPALAAAQRDDVCLSDGGTTHPAPIADAAAE